MSKHGWFEVDHQTQRLAICSDESINAAMLEPTDGPRIRASHLEIEVAPPTTDYIRVLFREAPPAVVPSSAKPSGRRYLVVPLGASLIAAAVAIAFLT